MYIETYGCAFNLADSMYIEELFLRSGWRVVERVGDADVVVVNTCVVRGNTERKIVKRVKELSTLSKRLVITGCMVSSTPSKIISVASDIVMVSPTSIDRIVEATERSGFFGSGLGGREREVIPSYRGGVTYILPIASGCAGSCTFCIVRIARGRLYSYDPTLIYKAFKDAVLHGAREVYLTAQDTAAYGLDRGGSLPDLIKKLLEVPGQYRIRVGMFNPMLVGRIIDGLLDVYKDERVYKFVHLPVQSGDDGVLRAMQRGYRASDFVYQVERFRSELGEDMQLATDVIVGYPGETEEAFENTVRLIERVRPDKVHLAKFSVRPHTPAASVKQLPDDVKKRRSSILSELVREIGLERNQRYVGRELRILVTGRTPRGQFEGRTDSYRVVVIPDELPNRAIGRFIWVKVVEAGPFYLVGRTSSSSL